MGQLTLLTVQWRVRQFISMPKMKCIFESDAKRCFKKPTWTTHITTIAAVEFAVDNVAFTKINCTRVQLWYGKRCAVLGFTGIRVT